MSDYKDEPYTVDRIRALLDILPEMLACEAGGMLQLNLRPIKRKTLKDKLVVESVQGMAPRPNRRSNTVYQIDNVAALMIDLETAITYALNDTQKLLLGRRFLQRFSKAEIASQDKCNTGTVKYNTRVAIQALVDYLERPKIPTPFGKKVYKGESFSHKRTYTSSGVAL